MSKIGKKPVSIPEKVEVKLKPGAVVVSGAKGSLKIDIPRRIKVKKKDKQILVTCLSEEKKTKALHGTIRQLIANAIVGVTKGWKKSLKVVGTGYRASLEQGNLVLSVGFSHLVAIKPPEGIKIKLEGQNKIHVGGVNKALVGQIAAKIRDVRPPDVYKGKGIRYEGEEVKLKPGKAAKTGIAGAMGE